MPDALGLHWTSAWQPLRSTGAHLRLYVVLHVLALPSEQRVAIADLSVVPATKQGLSPGMTDGNTRTAGEGAEGDACGIGQQCAMMRKAWKA